MWEARWGIPSRGDARFEDVAVVDHVLDLGLMPAEAVLEPDDELNELRRRAEAGLDPFAD